MKEIKTKSNTPIYVTPPPGGVPRSIRRVVRRTLGDNPAVRAAWVVQKSTPLSDERPSLLLSILFDPALWHDSRWHRIRLMNQVLQAIETRLPSGMPLDALALNRSPELYQATVESGTPVLDNRLTL